MSPISSIINGPGGKASTMRVSSLTVVATVMLTWSYVSIVKLELQPMDEWNVALVIGAMGVKAWQRGKETPGQETK